MTAPDDDDDLRWLAALGGRDGADADAEAAWLRAGYRAWGTSDKTAPPEPQPAFDTELALLLERGRAAGLNLPPSSRGPRRRGLLVAVFTLMAAGALWTLRPRPADAPWPPEVLRGDPPVWLLRDADPLQARERLAGRLQAAGATVLRYERLGRQGLEAEGAAALPPDFLQALWREQGVRPGADGALRVEFEAAP